MAVNVDLLSTAACGKAAGQDFIGDVAATFLQGGFELVALGAPVEGDAVTDLKACFAGALQGGGDFAGTRPSRARSSVTLVSRTTVMVPSVAIAAPSWPDVAGAHRRC